MKNISFSVTTIMAWEDPDSAGPVPVTYPDP
jgi:hypothetical protein